MKYRVEIEINKSREAVIKAFNNTENLKKWQPTLLSFSHESGDPGQDGATSKMVYDENGREMALIETITSNNFPDSFSATYEAKGVWNSMENFFVEVDENKTQWTMDTEYKFSGFMILMAFFMRGGFPKETLSSMNRFKEFVESA